jgi:hypothetical protein
VRLLSLGVNYEEVRMGEKCLYMDYSQVEVNETGENGTVMNGKGDGKDEMIDVETVKSTRKA